MDLLFDILLLVGGFILLIKGADYFVENASAIADKFGIPQIIIGLTIVAFGTSAPEAAVSISAAFDKSAELAIGNVLGSNILNILIILGITAVLTPVAVQKSTLKYEIPFVIFITALLGILGADGSLNLLDGIILSVIFILFMAYLVKSAKSQKNQALEAPQTEATDAPKTKNVFLLFLFTIISIGLIVFASNITVKGATGIAEVLGWSKSFIGLTVIALGTSLPELATSIIAARKGKADIAIGNIVGSNIFNILFVLGITSLITTVPFKAKFIIDAAVATLAAIVLLISVLNKDKKIKRPAGFIMLALYGGYFAYLLMTISD